MSDNSTDAKKVWQTAKMRLRKQSDSLYRQWFSKITPLEIVAGKIKLGVPDDFFASVVIDEYDDLMTDALKNVDGFSYNYTFEPDHEPPPFDDLAVEPEKTAPAAPDSPRVHAGPRPHFLGNGFTFENFVVGAENRHAFAAAKTAAENPGFYNPLYIYGSSGVGKTHLLHAVKNELEQTRPGIKVRFATCDELLNDFYELLMNKRSLSEFRSSIREVDVLLVDDVHSLARKTQMQEEFFNMFDALYNQQKQIILTSDKQPCEISDLDKRLETRFESGVTAQIVPPEFEARLAILRMMRRETVSPAPLSDAILDFLATNISSSVRRLKGAFIRLASYVSMTGTNTLSIAQAEDLLHSQLEDECSTREISIESIQKAVAAHFGITLADILGKTRTREIAEPRMIAMALCRELTKTSSSAIGQAFGRNHATILHAETQVAKLCSESEIIRRSVNQLRHQLQHH